jgi:hypothetical protein
MLCALISVGIGAQAEVYRWVDENGQVHYSDRKQQADAEDVTAQTKVQNLDTSQEERRKVAQILRPENEADRDYRRRQQAQQQNRQHDQQQADEAHQKYCNELQKLRDTLNGPVNLIDENGKVARYTEKERKADFEQASRLLAERCYN